MRDRFLIDPRLPKLLMDYISTASISPEKIEWMEKHSPQTPGHALDIGCGAGLFTKWLAERKWNTTGIDIQPPKLDRVKTICHDLEKGLPFPDNSFHLILAWDIFEHIANEEFLWREVFRILKPSGILLGSVPHNANQRLLPHNLTFKHHIDKTHHREYNTQDVQNKIKNVGLTFQQSTLKGPVSPKVFTEFIPFPSFRKPCALMIGVARRCGLLQFGELYGDIFFSAIKPVHP